MAAASAATSSISAMASSVTSPSLLPARLMRFFAKYPPQLFSAKHTGVTIPLTRREAQLAAETKGNSDSTPSSEPSISLPLAADSLSDTIPSETSTDAPIPSPTTIALTPVDDAVNPLTSSSPQPIATSRSDRFPPNPFMPFRNPETGRWRGAAIGLRRQAELVKIAKSHGVEALLPPGRKSTVFKEHRILEKGLRVRGTGEGQKVKGHIWERKLPATLEKRRTAMENMPAMIRDWKSRGHGRGWKKYPK